MLLSVAGVQHISYRLRMTETGIRHSAEQYGVWNRILDCYTFDMTESKDAENETRTLPADLPPVDIAPERARAERRSSPPPDRCL
jgi:hypothetical protein